MAQPTVILEVDLPLRFAPHHGSRFPYKYSPTANERGEIVRPWTDSPFYRDLFYIRHAANVEVDG